MRLYLLRHCKSSWTDFSLPDHDRPLAPRGVRAGSAMNEHLRELGVRIDLAFVSSATRAQETAALVLDAVADVQETRSELYLASPRSMLGLVAEIDASVESLVLVGHNPGMHDLALLLSSHSPDHPARDRLFEKYPTGALAEFELEADDWAAVSPAASTLTGFTRPKDLPDADARRL